MRITKSSSGSYQGSPVPKRIAQERAALAAAIEASKARYIPLVCEHMTALETDQVYAMWRPKKGLSWCETCNAWTQIGPLVKPVEYPLDPLF